MIVMMLMIVVMMMMIVIMMDDSYDVDDINYDWWCFDDDEISIYLWWNRQRQYFNVNDESTSTKGVIYYLSYNDEAQYY